MLELSQPLSLLAICSSLFSPTYVPVPTQIWKNGNLIGSSLTVHLVEAPLLTSVKQRDDEIRELILMIPLVDLRSTEKGGTGERRLEDKRAFRKTSKAYKRRKGERQLLLALSCRPGLQGKRIHGPLLFNRESESVALRPGTELVQSS